jgi:hypothetical protein
MATSEPRTLARLTRLLSEMQKETDALERLHGEQSHHRCTDQRSCRQQGFVQQENRLI